jgi:endoglucanase
LSSKTFISLLVVLLGLALAPSVRADPWGSWSPLPSMTTPRYRAAAAALSDGRVLVAGGIDGTGNATASAEIYDPTTNAWSAAASMDDARAFAAAAPLSGDRVLVAGGEVDGSASASTEIYDAETNTWSPAAPMEAAVEGPAAAALPDGTVWVAGGSGAGDAEIYDPVADAWSPATSISPRVGAAAASLGGGDVLLAGGSDPADQEPVATAEVDSPDTNYESVVGSLEQPTDEPAAASIGGGQVLMAGGSAYESYPWGSANAEIYDAATQRWGDVVSMQTPRYGAVAAPLPDGQVLVAGGDSEFDPLSSVEAFSPPTPAQPVDGSAPSIQDNTNSYSGIVYVGDTLSATSGEWGQAFALDLTYTYQWQRCGSSSCQDVSSAGLPGSPPFLYRVTAADEGSTLRVVVTADDQGSDGTGESVDIGPVRVPGYHFDSSSIQSELPLVQGGHAPYLQIAADRDDTSGPGQVSYRVWNPTGSTFPNFAPLSGTLQFLPGQTQSEIEVPLTDHGVPIMPPSLEVQLFDGSPQGVIAPSDVTLPIGLASSVEVRNPLNPLELPSTPMAGNPLSGARFFADYFQSLPGRQAVAWAASDPSAARKVAVIAEEPNTERFGAWNGSYPGWNVWQYLSRAEIQEPGTVPMISTYRLVDGHCGRYSDPPAEQAAYHSWITSLAEGIGPHPAVLFLEMDSLITTGCLSAEGVTVRMHELRDAINVLSNDPHLVIYLDAGAADALPASRAASLLRRAGVKKIQGFYLNSTHFDWTSKEIAYGEKISRLTGGKHFVINTAENGQGPVRPRHPAKQGNEVLCDPPGRGLGPLPTADTGYRNVDAFAWIANPGVSGGECQPGAPPSGVFWPTLALQLVRHENFRVR